ncbi:hypothetical protein [Aeromonas phage AS-yj]|uniref:Uncharacterized protein n=2 Tax=Caudoviricetes TaxID=2731619 RepID=A0A291LF67_9CAUD|nr:hypothetical protein [Aeromonas phage AS-yj]
MSSQVDSNKILDVLYDARAKLTNRELVCLGECILLWGRYKTTEKRQKAFRTYIKTVYHSEIRPDWVMDLIKQFDNAL